MGLERRVWWPGFRVFSSVFFICGEKGVFVGGFVKTGVQNVVF
jgi:hypothetical protein